MINECYCYPCKQKEIKTKYYIARAHLKSIYNIASDKAREDYKVMLCDAKSVYDHIISTIQNDYRESIEKMNEERDQEIYMLTNKE